MPFAEFLQSFKSMATPQDLNYLFGKWRDSLDKSDWGVPSQGEVVEFIGLLQQAIANEANKDAAKRQARVEALDKVRQYVQDPGTPKFQGIEPNRFAFQLALRVREPSLINQTDIGVCGVNSVVIYFAKTDPKGFVEYATQLMKEGRGRFRTLEVIPSGPVRNGELNGKWPAADVVTLGSLGLGFWPAKFKILQGHTPGEVLGLLQSAGYTAIDKTLTLTRFTLSWEALAENLRDAAMDVASGKMVILKSNSDLQNAMVATRKANDAYVQNKYKEQVRQNPTKHLLHLQEEVVSNSRKGQAGLPLQFNFASTNNNAPGGITQEHFQAGSRTNHFTLISKLSVDGNLAQGKVRIKCYTWGNSYDNYVSLESFLPFYGGYIVASAMPDPGKTESPPASPPAWLPVD
jgi:hypothetical protein